MGTFFVFVGINPKNKHMPPCKNSSTGYYTGWEPSPKGFGYCARSSVVGRRMVGKDGDVWIVQQDKNGRLAWQRERPGRRTTPGTPKSRRKTPVTPKSRRKTPGTPKSRRTTPRTPRCKPDQIYNPRTNRCVLKSGKIGRELSRKGYK